MAIITSEEDVLSRIEQPQLITSEEEILSRLKEPIAEPKTKKQIPTAFGRRIQPGLTLPDILRLSTPGLGIVSAMADEGLRGRQLRTALDVLNSIGLGAGRTVGAVGGLVQTLGEKRPAITGGAPTLLPGVSRVTKPVAGFLQRWGQKIQPPPSEMAQIGIPEAIIGGMIAPIAPEELVTLGLARPIGAIARAAGPSIQRATGFVSNLLRRAPTVAENIPAVPSLSDIATTFRPAPKPLPVPVSDLTTLAFPKKPLLPMIIPEAEHPLLKPFMEGERSLKYFSKLKNDAADEYFKVFGSLEGFEDVWTRKMTENIEAVAKASVFGEATPPPSAIGKKEFVRALEPLQKLPSQVKAEASIVAVKTETAYDRILQRAKDWEDRGIPRKDLHHTVDVPVPPPAIVTEPLNNIPRGGWGTVLAESTKAIERQGIYGQRYAGIARMYRDQTEALSQRFKRGDREGIVTGAEKIFKGLSLEESQAVRDLASNITPDILPTEDLTRRALQLRGDLDEFVKIAREPKALGKTLDVGYLKDYFPHVVNSKFLMDAKGQTELMRRMLKEGMVKDAKSAREVLDDLIGLFKKSDDDSLYNHFADARSVFRARNLEFERKINDPTLIKMFQKIGLYESDPRVALSRYYNNGAKRIKYSEHFGVNAEVSDALIDGIKKSGGEHGLVKRIHDDLISYKNPANQQLDNITQGMTNLLNAMVLPFSGMAQLPPVAVTAAVVRTKTMFSGLGKVMSSPKASYELTKDYSAILTEVADNLIDDASNVTGKYAGFARGTRKIMEGVFKWGYAPVSMRAMDNTTRVISVIPGRIHVMEIFEQIKQARISGKPTMGSRLAETDARFLFPEIEDIFSKRGLNTSLTEYEIGIATKRFSGAVAGKTAPLNLPYYANSKLGRIFTNLMRTALNNATTQNELIFKPAFEWIRTGGKAGSITRLMKFFAYTEALGMPLTLFKNYIFDRDRSKQTMTGFALESLANGYFGAIVGDIIYKTIAGSKGELRVPSGFDVWNTLSRAISPALFSEMAGLYQTVKEPTSKGAFPVVRIPAKMIVGEEGEQRKKKKVKKQEKKVERRR